MKKYFSNEISNVLQILLAGVAAHRGRGFVQRFEYLLGGRTNKDRLCEERTTILSGCWTSPVYLHTVVYKKISFFERGVRSESSRSVPFFRRGSALTYNRLKKNDYFIKVFSSCLNIT